MPLLEPTVTIGSHDDDHDSYDDNLGSHDDNHDNHDYNHGNHGGYNGNYDSNHDSNDNFDNYDSDLTLMSRRTKLSNVRLGSRSTPLSFSILKHLSVNGGLPSTSAGLPLQRLV